MVVPLEAKAHYRAWRLGSSCPEPITEAPTLSKLLKRLRGLNELTPFAEGASFDIEKTCAWVDGEWTLRAERVVGTVTVHDGEILTQPIG